MMSMALRVGRCAKRKNNNEHLPLRKKKNRMSPAARCSTVRCMKKKKKVEEEESPPTVIKKGDVVDISDLLFTKDRDYVINRHNQQVKAKQLEDKVIVLFFMNLSFEYVYCLRETLCLLDIYKEIQPKGCMEVVFIGVPDATSCSNCEQKRFEKRYYKMPWPAIPFWDLESRKYLAKRFCSISMLEHPKHLPSVVIDPGGLVLQCDGMSCFLNFGAPGYPFSDEKIKLIISEDDAAKKAQHPSITQLLASPERNYVISNNGDQVVVSDLEDKVVALYFYEENEIDPITPKIQEIYEELAKNKKNFEIVLIYAHDTPFAFHYTTEVSFQKRFSTMPWLAIPFRDPRCMKLDRILEDPHMLIDLGPDPTLVIIGPHGKFSERFGMDILLNFGVAAYPFTRKSVAKLEAEKLKRLKLEMFWRDPNTLFRQKDGTTVPFSQLVGKRTILLFGSHWFSIFADFFRMLEARYHQMKGTSDEFYVIQISSNWRTSSFDKSFPWLMHPEFASESNECKLFLSIFYKDWGLLAFDNDGRLVCRTVSPSIRREDADFPFHAHSLERDAVIQLAKRFDWWDLSSDDDDDDSNN